MQGIKVEESTAEKACRLLQELEQEGASLEESFKDASSVYLPDLDVGFPDFAKPGYAESVLPSLDLESSEQMLIDLETILPYADDSPPQSPMDDLDVLLQTHAQTLLSEDSLDDSSFHLQPLSQQMPPTPTSCVTSPGPSSVGSQSPDYASSVCSDESTDPEWVPEQQSPAPKEAKSGGRARRKPYSRAPTNRAERKKLQNKNAATRYRNKKKQEEEELLQVEAELLERNRELQAKKTEIETEMRIVKDLLRTSVVLAFYPE
ncbi:Hypothetical predicted protein [Cloeon dipterum]|uniref:BZIP domain-containing protein n=1 Tax=Cloeon dipterum TaxID=197152 RepID=A0A8S1D8G8_9INSE|nr:Hypothetical predicted protein [Cloeon dipterum]